MKSVNLLFEICMSCHLLSFKFTTEFSIVLLHYEAIQLLLSTTTKATFFED